MAHHWMRIAGVVFLAVVGISPFSIGSGRYALIHAQKATSISKAEAPSPRSVLGFMPGDDRTIADWGQITDYFARLDKASDRVLVQTIGQSTLQRPIIAAFISARENLLALNKYKEIQRKLADPRTIQGELERDHLISDGRVVVAISCSIHSTEIVASQMSMQLAFELASTQNPEIREILQNTILDPDSFAESGWYRYCGKLVPQNSWNTFRGEKPAGALPSLRGAR